MTIVTQASVPASKFIPWTSGVSGNSITDVENVLKSQIEPVIEFTIPAYRFLNVWRGGAIAMPRVSLQDAYYKVSQQLDNAVVSDPDIKGGIPVIRGTRVPVWIVLSLLADGIPIDRVQTNYPQLSLNQIHDAIRFASLICCIEDDDD